MSSCTVLVYAEEGMKGGGGGEVRGGPEALNLCPLLYLLQICQMCLAVNADIKSLDLH